jgi:hypothetical protein
LQRVAHPRDNPRNDVVDGRVGADVGEDRWRREEDSDEGGSKFAHNRNSFWWVSRRSGKTVDTTRMDYAKNERDQPTE